MLMGPFEGKVNGSREVDGNMKWRKMEDPTFQMQEYMNHSADFQRRLVSVRESRALLEKNHRMRKEKVSHMGFQFKQILWQMRRAQEDAYLAQERYLKLLQLGGHNLRYQKGNGKVVFAEDKDLQVNRVAEQSGCQVTSHQNEHQSNVYERKSPTNTSVSCLPHIIGSSQHKPHCKSAPLRPLEDQDFPLVHHHCAEDLANLDLIRGRSFRFYTAAEENHGSVGRNNGDAREIQSSTTIANDNAELSTETRPMNVCGQEESKGELESILSTDDFASTSVFVCSNLDSQSFLLKQQPAVVANHEKQGQDGGQNLSLVQESICEGNKMRNCELDFPCSIMPTSPMMKTSTTWKTEWREGLAKDIDKSSSEDARKSFLKIQKSDFLYQTISKELENFTKNSSLVCSVSKPTTIEEARVNEDVGPFKAERTADKNNEIVKCKTTEGQVEDTSLTTERKRIIIEAWHPNEKLEVLATITNTMFLWDIEHTSNQEQHYGTWAECEPMISVALAARKGQQELFDFLETVTGTMSRPMICCGAVCELLKVYQQEKLLPVRFIEDIFAYESTESKDQCWSKRAIKGLTFEHLEVYQEEEHTKFWQMLVHHVVSVKDHKLASLRQIAQVFVEILLPSCTQTKSFPTKKIKDIHEGLLEFFVTGFKSKTLHYVHVKIDSNECPVATKKLQHISKLRGEHHGSEIQSQIKQTGFCNRETKGLSTIHRSRRSDHLRPVSSRNGLFSCFGSVMRNKFRIWRLKALSRGVDTIDDAVVCILRNRTQETLHP